MHGARACCQSVTPSQLGIEAEHAFLEVPKIQCPFLGGSQSVVERSKYVGVSVGAPDV